MKKIYSIKKISSPNNNNYRLKHEKKQICENLTESMLCSTSFNSNSIKECGDLPSIIKRQNNNKRFNFENKKIVTKQYLLTNINKFTKTVSKCRYKDYCKDNNNYYYLWKLLPYLFLVNKQLLYIIKSMWCALLKFQHKNVFFTTVPSLKHLLQCYILFTVLIFAQQFSSVKTRVVVTYNNVKIVTKSPQSAIEEMNPILRHRFSTKFQERLKLLHNSLIPKPHKIQFLRDINDIINIQDRNAIKFKSQGSEGGRNCFFSPVQCRLPYLSEPYSSSTSSLTGIGAKENNNLNDINANPKLNQVKVDFIENKSSSLDQQQFETKRNLSLAERLKLLNQLKVANKQQTKQFFEEKFNKLKSLLYNNGYKKPFEYSLYTLVKLVQ